MKRQATRMGEDSRRVESLPWKCVLRKSSKFQVFVKLVTLQPECGGKPWEGGPEDAGFSNATKLG